MATAADLTEAVEIAFDNVLAKIDGATIGAAVSGFISDIKAALTSGSSVETKLLFWIVSLNRAYAVVNEMLSSSVTTTEQSELINDRLCRFLILADDSGLAAAVDADILDAYNNNFG